MDIKFIKQIPIFSTLSDEHAQMAVGAVEIKSFSAGDIVFQQGEIGNGLYGIIFGEAEVIMDDRQIVTLGNNDFFGEMSLIAEEPRSATVRALSDLSVFFLSKQIFEQIKGDLGEGVKREILRRAEQDFGEKFIKLIFYF